MFNREKVLKLENPCADGLKFLFIERLEEVFSLYFQFKEMEEIRVAEIQIGYDRSLNGSNRSKKSH